MEFSKDEMEILKFSLKYTLNSIGRFSGAVPNFATAPVIRNCENLLKKFE